MHDTPDDVEIFGRLVRVAADPPSEGLLRGPAPHPAVGLVDQYVARGALQGEVVAGDQVHAHRREVVLVDDAEAAAEIFNLKKENVYEELEQNRYKKNAALNKNNNNSLYLCEMDFIACLSRLPIDTIDDLLSDFNLDMINDNEIKNILKIMLANLLKISDIKQITHELGDQFVELAMREIAGDDAYKEALKNKKQIELNYLKKRQNELIEQMRTTSDKSLQISMLQELNSLTKQIAGKK